MGGRLHSRGQAKRADYVLFYKPNLPVAVIEAKDNRHSVGDGRTDQHHHPGLLQRRRG
ncbi:MAG: hypothetical protein ACP5D7_17475 [Limnospira sp.]